MRDNFPTIKTEQLLLREMRESDISAHFDIFSTDAVTEHYGCYSYTSIAQSEQQVRRYMAAYAEKKSPFFRWAIALNDTAQTYIGSCGFHGIKEHSKSIEIGYELHPNYWGKGLAFEGVSHMISYCFGHNFPFCVNRIAATTDVDSPASISLLTRLGFVEEGILRDYGFWRDQFQTVRLFSLLRRDWANLNIYPHGYDSN